MRNEVNRCSRRAAPPTRPRSFRARDAADRRGLRKPRPAATVPSEERAAGDDASADGAAGEGAPLVLTQELTLGAIVSVLANGRKAMPAYGAVMPPGELQDVAAYVHDRLLAP